MDQELKSGAVRSEEKIEWLAPEYDHKPQSVDWFWALGVIVVAGATASIIFENYFFAILLVIGGILLGHFAIRKPGMIDYELNKDGFKVKNRLYPYEDMKHFWVKKEEPSTLFIYTKRFFIPEISMPIYPHIADKLRAKMLENNVEEKEMVDHTSVKVMEYLGF